MKIHVDHLTVVPKQLREEENKNDEKFTVDYVVDL